ncbi:unnamed protein product [Alternaria alternata]
MTHTVTKDGSADHIEHLEKGLATPSTSSDTIDLKLAAKLRHRVDWRLIPALGAMYGISLMDRKNVSNAAIAGMLSDLRMSRGYGYNLVNLCFFITYVLCQPFMIIVCRKVGPRLFLPGICVAWGAVIVGFGFTNNWQSLIPLRIFIMEGVITIGVALFAITFIVKFPDEEKAKPSWGFLKPHELDVVIDRLNADRNDATAEKFSWKKFLEPAKDWYIYAFALILLFVTTIAYGFAFFLPIILSTKLKFSIAMSQCLGAPPYAASGFLMYGAAWFSDKYKTRGPVLVVLCLVSLIGLPIMGFASNPWAQYVGVFITVSGTNSAIPSVMAYQANNIRGQWRRAFCSASLTGIGGIGGIAGALIFRTEDAPSYVPGFAACMACNVLVILLVGVLTLWFRSENAKADRGEKVLLEDPNFRFTI